VGPLADYLELGLKQSQFLVCWWHWAWSWLPIPDPAHPPPSPPECQTNPPVCPWAWPVSPVFETSSPWSFEKVVIIQAIIAQQIRQWIVVEIHAEVK